MKAFILELGGDFIFMGEQFRLQVGNQDFYIDLLFYHRGLSALVPFFSYNIDTRETLKQTSDEMETNN